MGNELSFNGPISEADRIKEYDEGCILSGTLPLCRGGIEVEDFPSCTGQDDDMPAIRSHHRSSSSHKYLDDSESVSVVDDDISGRHSHRSWKSSTGANMEPGVATELHKLISGASTSYGGMSKWEAILKRVRMHPSESMAKDEKCRTPLALACADSDCPSNVIREILSVNPRAPSLCDKNGSYPLHFYAACESSKKEVSLLQILTRHNEDAALTRNRFGNTPLQAAIEANSPRPDILKALILANTKAVAITNSHGSYPLHYAWKDRTSNLDIVRLLLRLYPKAVSLQNDYGATPIFMAVNWDASMEVMEVLLHACPSAVKIKDERGICSISSAWNLFIHQVKVDDEMDVSKEKERVKRNRRLIKFAASPYDLEGKAEIWWNKMQLLLKASYHNSVEDPLPNSKWRVLHAAAGCDCPPELLTLVLKLYRNQVFLKDENDNLPIHIVCRTPSYVKQPFEAASEDMMAKIASEFPEGVKIKDKNGRLPLHIAVESKKTWDEGVQRLVELYPESVRAYDRKTRLYPAMLMAVRDDGDETHENIKRIAKTNFKTSIWKKLPSHRREQEIKKVMIARDIAEITTVYELFRKAPDIIARLGDELRNKEKEYLRKDNEKQTERFREMNFDAIALKRILVTKEREYKVKLGELEKELTFLREREEHMIAMQHTTNPDNRDDIACN